MISSFEMAELKVMAFLKNSDPLDRVLALRYGIPYDSFSGLFGTSKKYDCHSCLTRQG